MTHRKENKGHISSKIVQCTQNYRNCDFLFLFASQQSARAQCMTWHVNFVRSKYTQKKLARTSSSKYYISFELYSISYEHQRKYIEFKTAVHAHFCLTLKLRETRGHGHLRHLLGSYVICGLHASAFLSYAQCGTHGN